MSVLDVYRQLSKEDPQRIRNLILENKTAKYTSIAHVEGGGVLNIALEIEQNKSITIYAEQPGKPDLNEFIRFNVDGQIEDEGETPAVV